MQRGNTRGGGGGIPQGDFSAGKIPYFNLVRNFPLIFRGEVRNFPHAEFCPCQPPYHRDDTGGGWASVPVHTSAGQCIQHGFVSAQLLGA